MSAEIYHIRDYWPKDQRQVTANMPFERLPVCACDPGHGEPPTALEMLACKDCVKCAIESAKAEAAITELAFGDNRPSELP